MTPKALIWPLIAAAQLWAWTTPAFAAAVWLDEPLAAWNEPGMAIPIAPPQAGTSDPQCARLHRPPETAEDEAVVGAGWTLFGAYQSGWGTRLIYGLSDHDGMCRPVGYQEFVFVNGIFAGTISPVPMNARTDGAEGRTTISVAGDRLLAQFARYAATDPLCCPSRTTSVDYEIAGKPDAPVVVPAGVYTSPAAP